MATRMRGHGAHRGISEISIIPGHRGHRTYARVRGGGGRLVRLVWQYVRVALRCRTTHSSVTIADEELASRQTTGIGVSPDRLLYAKIISTTCRDQGIGADVRKTSALAISMLFFIVYLAGCSTPADTSPGSFPKFLTEHVVILVIDGARYTETWGEPRHPHLPNIDSKIAPNGIVLTGFQNSGYTETTAGHTALMTGVNQSIDNTGLEYPANPSFLHYLRKQNNLSQDKAWIITSKDKLFVLSKTTQAGWTDDSPSIDCGADGQGGGGYRSDAITFSNACLTLTSYHPKAILINFKDPDSFGHANDWTSYLDAIKAIDAYTGEIWNSIQNDPILSNKTTLFIVNDHGRHSYNFIDHGDECEGCRHIICIAIGPDFKRNYSSAASYDQRDLNATVGFLLRLNMPTSKGAIIREILNK